MEPFGYERNSKQMINKNNRPQDSGGNRKKITKVITWSCEDGCGNTNTRRILSHKVVNDDVCDFCGKSYHEPVTTTLVSNLVRKKKRDKEKEEEA